MNHKDENINTVSVTIYREVNIQMVNKAKVTIKDVAKDAGVGLGSVSRAINGQPGISPKTKEKILKSIEKLGYVPNQAAQSMRSNKYRNIVFFANISNVAFSRIAKGIQSELEQHGYTISFCDIGVADVKEKISSFLTGRMFDGIILSVPREDDEELNEFLSEIDSPIVTLDRDIPHMAGAVVTDYFSSVKKAAEYLLSLQHEKIALIGVTNKIRPTRVSIQAFEAAYERFGKQVHPELIFEGDFTPEAGANIMLELLPAIRSGEITAILSLNNQIFKGLLKVMREYRLSYPDDVSIITVEDSELTELLNPPITVIKRPLQEVGVRLAKTVLELIEREDSSPVMLPTEFIIRESCAVNKPKGS